MPPGSRRGGSMKRCGDVSDLMSFETRYGSPNAARRKTIKGFLDGAGGDEDVEGLERPRKDANAAGVSEVASTGGGRPVILAKRVRSQRRMVNMPRMEPRVLRRFVNCSATEIIATR